MTAPKPRLLDLFAGAGGAARGYQLAGFHVTGIDNKPQPRYVGDAFIQADALNPPVRLEDFDAIHASPPCQAYTGMIRRYPEQQAAHPDLYAPVKAMLEASGRPWVIENVVGSPLRNHATVCGQTMGLRVRRHRLFESNVLLMSSGCRHSNDHVGVFGHHPDGGRLWTRADGDRPLRRAASLADGSDAMGIDWMEWRELTQAIPPSYTSFIGAQLLDFLSVKSEHPMTSAETAREYVRLMDSVGRVWICATARTRSWWCAAPGWHSECLGVASTDYPEQECTCWCHPVDFRRTSALPGSEEKEGNE